MAEHVVGEPSPAVVSGPRALVGTAGLQLRRVAGLVGREAELARVREMVAEVAAGRGGSVWVNGEPGIGKSALLSVALADARSLDCQVFGSSARELARPFPLRVLLDALLVGPEAADAGREEIAAMLWDRGLADVVTPGDAVAAAGELLLVLVERLCAADPVAILVDDLQWADEMSLAVWGRLHRMVRQLPLLLFAAARPVPQRPEVVALRRAVSGPDLEVIGLGPLPDAQVNELVRHLIQATPGPGLRRLARQAGGNPLYVHELVDALRRDRRLRVDDGTAVVDDTTAPPSLAAAIAARLGFLSQPTTEVLQIAALLGTEFDVEHLGLLAGRVATALVPVVQEALAAGVLAPAGDRLMFRHTLISQALYRATPLPLRAKLHRQAAQTLANAGAPAERVAEQLLAVPYPNVPVVDAWLTEWVSMAAPSLIYRAPQIAVDLIHRVGHTVEDPRSDQLDAHLATALFLLGRYEQVEPLARRILARTHDPIVAGRMAWTLAFALLRAGRHDEALGIADQALRDDTLPAVWIARIRAVQAMILFNSHHFDQALTVAAQAEIDGREANDRIAICYALHALSVLEARHRRDMAASLEAIDQALAMTGDEPETNDLRLMLLGDRAAALGNLGRLDDADRAFGRALALAERAGTPMQLAAIRVHAAELCFFLGRWDDALAELDAATDLQPGAPQLTLSGLCALIAVHRDDQTSVSTHLRNVDDIQLTTAEVRYHARYLLVARAFSAERDHQPRQALTRLLTVFDPEHTLTFPGLTYDSLPWLPDVIRLALANDRRATAEAAMEACAVEEQRQPLPFTTATSQHCRGMLDADPAVLLSAGGTYDRLGLPLYRAQALENAAVLLADGGQAGTARSAYAEALRIYSDLEASWDVVRADRRLRSLGLRRVVRGRRPTAGWDALTATELKIADLVAAGNSNSDIAIELFLSRATVSSHISHILTKLHAQSRVDIAREVTNRRHQRPPDRAGEP